MKVLKVICCLGLSLSVLLLITRDRVEAQGGEQPRGAEVGFKAKDCSFTLRAVERGLILEYQNAVREPQLLSSRVNQEQRSVEMLFNCQAQIKPKRFNTGHEVFSTLSLRSLGGAFELQFTSSSTRRLLRPLIEYVREPQPLVRVLLTELGVGETSAGKAAEEQAVAAPEPLEQRPRVDEPITTPESHSVSQATEEKGGEAVLAQPQESEPGTEEDIALPAPDVIERLSAERLGVPVIDESVEIEAAPTEAAEQGPVEKQQIGTSELAGTARSEEDSRPKAQGQPAVERPVEPAAQQLLPPPESFGERDLGRPDIEPVVWEGQAIAVFVSMLVLFTVCGTGILTWYRTKVVGPREARRQLYSNVGGSTEDLSACYALLGVRSNDSTETIRKRYKHLVKVFHADRLSSQQLPEEMLSLANERFQQIQDAYERIKSARGM